MQPQRFDTTKRIANAVQFDDTLMTVGISGIVEYWLPKLFSNVFASKLHSRLSLRFYGLEYNQSRSLYYSEWLKLSQWYFDINQCGRYDASAVFIEALKSKRFELVSKLIVSADIYQWEENQFKKLTKWILNELIFNRNKRLVAIDQAKLSHLPKHLRNTIKNFDKQNINTVGGGGGSKSGGADRDYKNNNNNNNGVLLKIPFSFFLSMFKL